MTRRKPPASPPPAKRPVGKPPYQPTDEHRQAIDTMVGVGLAQVDICAVLKITIKTLHKYYRRELDTAHARLVVRMRAKLIAKANAGDTLCLLHVNKVLGWNEKLIMVDATADVDLSTLTEAELVERIQKLRRNPAVIRARAARASTVH